MANVKISALPAASALSGAELFPIVQGGTTKQTTVSALSAVYPQTAAELAAGVTPVNLQWPELWVKRYGCVCDGVTNDSVALNKADLVGGGTRAVISQGTMLANVTMSSPFADTLAQIFTTGSVVTLNGNPFIRPEWFGNAAGNIRLAVNATPSTGGTIKLRTATYPPSYDTGSGVGAHVAGLDYLAKSNITLDAAGMPTYNSTFNAYLPGSGTIIQGQFGVCANGFKILNGLGVDASAAVCTALYGGVAQTAFAFYQPNQAAPVAAATDVYIEAVKGVCSTTAAAVHAVLFENINGGVALTAIGAQGVHGVVVKSLNMQLNSVKAYLNGSNGFICKADIYVAMGNVQVNEVDVVGAGAGTSVDGVHIHAFGADTGAVEIGIIRANGFTNALHIEKATHEVADATVGILHADTCTTGILQDGGQRCSVATARINNCTDAVSVSVNTTVATNSVGDLTVTNATNAVNSLGFITIGNLLAQNVSAYLFKFSNSAARIFVTGSVSNQVVGGGVSIQNAANAFTNLTTTLTNSWANFGSGNSPFALKLGNGKVYFEGLIRSGSASGFLASMQNLAPAATLRLVGDGSNSGAVVAAEVIVGSGAGGASITNYAAMPTFVSLDGCAYPIPYP